MNIVRVFLFIVLICSTEAVEVIGVEALCANETRTASIRTTSNEQSSLSVEVSWISGRQVTTSPTPRLHTRSSRQATTPCQLPDNSTNVDSGLRTTTDSPSVGRSWTSTVSSVPDIHTETHVTSSVDPEQTVEVLNRSVSEQATTARLTMQTNRKWSDPEVSDLCCTTPVPASYVTGNATLITFLAMTGSAATATQESTEFQLVEESTSKSILHSNDDMSADSVQTQPAPNNQHITTTTNVVTRTDDNYLPHNRTLNFVFDGNCLELKRRGAVAETRFRAVVVDALSTGLSVSRQRLVAGDVRCGSLNLSITLLDASNHFVHLLMTTLAAVTLQVSVEDLQETFVLTRVELGPLPTSNVTGLPLDTMTTTAPQRFGKRSVEILIVFIVIGALAVLAGTVSAAIYLYFRRMYCRTFVVNRRALRWSSRASDTVQVINVDDDDSTSGACTSSRPTNDDADWSPSISGSGFSFNGGNTLPVMDWSPHYCKARFRRLIAPPPAPTLTSLAELDDEAGVDLCVDGSARHGSRPRTGHLLQSSPALHRLHIISTDDGERSRERTNDQREKRKLECNITGGGSLDWLEEEELFTNASKERATPF